MNASGPSSDADTVEVICVKSIASALLPAHAANRERMLRVLRQRKSRELERERGLARRYVRVRKTWKALLKEKEKRRNSNELANNGAAPRTRERSNSSSSLLGTSSGSAHSIPSGADVDPASASPFRRRDAIRSEYEQQKILANLLEIEKKKNLYLKTVAKMDRAPYETDRMKKRFSVFKENENGLFDPLEDRALQKASCVWSDVERLIFVDKFLQFPKRFHRISAFLANKSTRDCIAYYYDSKKAIPYKELLREQQQRRRGKVSWVVLRRVLRHFNIRASDEDLSARCFATDFSQAAAYAESNVAEDCDVDSDEELSGFRSRAAMANYVKQMLPISDNTHKLVSLRGLIEEGKRMREAELIEECHRHMLQREAEGTEENAEAAASATRKKISNRSRSSEPDPIITARPPPTPSASKKRGRKSNRESSSTRTPTKWNAEEKSRYVNKFRVIGKDWKELQHHFPTKTVSQVKNFYQNHRIDLGLGKLAKELIAQKTDAAKPRSG